MPTNLYIIRREKIMINTLVKLSEIFPLQFSNAYVRMLFYTIIGVVLFFTFLIPYFVRKGKERKAEKKAKEEKKNGKIQRF